LPPDANRIVAKSSERGEPPCDVDPIEELVRIVGHAHETLLALIEQACATPARIGQGAGDGKELRRPSLEPLWNLARINQPRPRKVRTPVMPSISNG
jgi:hypothetical protein